MNIFVFLLILFSILLEIIFFELLLKKEFVLLLFGDKVKVFELDIFKFSFELFFEFELLLEDNNLLTLILTIEKSSSGLNKFKNILYKNYFTNYYYLQFYV